MKCKYCNREITEAQNKTYEQCCDDICQNRARKLNCKNCGIPIDKENNMYSGFCSGGCSQEYSER